MANWEGSLRENTRKTYGKVLCQLWRAVQVFVAVISKSDWHPAGTMIGNINKLGQKQHKNSEVLFGWASQQQWAEILVPMVAEAAMKLPPCTCKCWWKGLGYQGKAHSQPTEYWLKTLCTWKVHFRALRKHPQSAAFWLDLGKAHNLQPAPNALPVKN